MNELTYTMVGDYKDFDRSEICDQTGGIKECVQ